MSLSSNNKRRKRRKSTAQPLVQVGQGYLMGLQIISTTSQIFDAKESTIQPPNIIINNDTVILDYSDVTRGINSQNKDAMEGDVEKLKSFFQATVSIGDTVTITDAKYLNELMGDSNVYDLSGEYEFVSFDSNKNIVVLTKVSINNPSDTYDFYSKKYFINGTPKWTSSNEVVSSKTRTVNEIVNRFGPQSANSFRRVLGNIKKNDNIHFQIDSATILSFTVKEYYVSSDVEHLIVEETVEPQDLFAENIFVVLKRRPRPS
jgi:hypothetical protein